jgi:hypothetical protein
MSDNIRKIKLDRAKSHMKRAFAKKRPVFLWGPPGVGKSDILAQIADEGNNLLIDLRMALLDPTDIKGYPYRDEVDNKMKWAAPAELPSQELASQYETVYLFLDELNSAPPSVQATAYQLILNRRVGNYVLPDNVVLAAAGNRDTDKGVTYRMPSPLANRFLHLEVEVNHGVWQDWAIINDIIPDVVGYLAFAKQDLFDFEPKSSSRSFATPRTWAFVSQMLEDSDMTHEEEMDIVTGLVGEGMAIKFMNHKKNASNLPKPSEILSGKVKELKKLEISSKYALTVGMSYELKNIQDEGDEKELTASFNNFINFLMDNFEPEMCVLGCKIALSEYDIDVDFADVDRIDEWVDRYGKYMSID